MKAWLLINSFLKTAKFAELYSLLVSCAEKHNIKLIAAEYKDVISSSEKPDFAILWDKDFYTARILEQRGIRLFNSAAAGEICDDKALTYIHLEKNGVPTPKTLITPKAYETTGYSDFSFIDPVEKELGYPMVIKNVHGSFGREVYLAQNRQDAESIISSHPVTSYIMQEYISGSFGQDIRINIVGDRFVSAIRRTNRNDFRSNITNGGQAETYMPADTEISLAVSAARATGCDFAGVDILNGNLVCEVNSSPHFKSSDNVNHVSVADRIFEYVKEKL